MKSGFRRVFARFNKISIPCTFLTQLRVIYIKHENYVVEPEICNSTVGALNFIKPIFHFKSEIVKEMVIWTCVV